VVMMKVLKVFPVTVAFELTFEQLAEARTAINLHYFNDEVCNKVGPGGHLVAKYPPNEAAVDAHWNVGRHVRTTLDAELLEDGTVRLVTEKILDVVA
jgi:hypothetical protein